MGKQFSTIRLLGLLGLLLLIYAATQFFGSSGRSKSFKEDLISLDTAKVNKMIITKEGKSITLEDQAGHWFVTDTENNRFSAVEDRIKSALSSLQTIKPARIATRNTEKWKDFQVDSSGTRIEVFESGKKTNDIVLGRFGMEGQRSFYSFVRLYADDEVYAANDFMAFSISPEAANYRNQTLTNFKKDSLEAIRFEYPSDSSFSLTKIQGFWMSEKFAPDSTLVSQYVNSVSRISSDKFASQEVAFALRGEPMYKIVLAVRGSEDIEIFAYPSNEEGEALIKSTANDEGVFKDKSLFEKVFKSEASFKRSESP